MQLLNIMYGCVLHIHILLFIILCIYIYISVRKRNRYIRECINIMVFIFYVGTPRTDSERNGKITHNNIIRSPRRD